MLSAEFSAIVIFPALSKIAAELFKKYFSNVKFSTQVWKTLCINAGSRS
jgi:hypothetical protein